MSNLSESSRKNAASLIVLGGVLALASAIAFLWGVNYSSNLSNAAYAGLASLVGQTDSTYQLALWAKNLGAVGFIIGVVMTIIGFVKRS